MKNFLIGLASALALAAFAYWIVIPAFAGKILVSSAIVLGPVTFRIYGLTMALSVLTGFLICRKYAWRFGIDRSEIENFAFYLVIVSFVGARLYYVIFAWNYFSQNLPEIYKVWHGGISIYGALITGALFTYFWSRRKAYGFKQLLDLVALGLPLAQALGRWGNFFNQEAFGYPTDVPWKMFIAASNRPAVYANSEYFHPTFLYESILMVIVFVILVNLLGRLKPGVLGLLYLCLYSLVRFFIEPWRLDSAWIGSFRSDQVVALLVFLVCGTLVLVWQFRRPDPAQS